MNLKTTKLRLGQYFVAMFLTAVIVVLLMTNKAVFASGVDYMETLNAGAASVIDAQINVTETDLNAFREAVAKGAETQLESTLVISNVNNSLNVRAEGNEESKIIGKMYQYCGGTIIERSNGWTKFQSGELVGWAKDEYLLFGDEAQKIADEVGEIVVTVNADALRVRKEANPDAGVYGLIGHGDVLSGIEIKDEWVGVEYDDKEGFLAKEFVDITMKMPEGETSEAIAVREQALLAAKLALTTNLGAYAPLDGDLDLLASIIYCEARGESYNGKVAVGAVVLNRVRSGRFPNSIADVIYSPGQFSPVLSGKFATVLSAKAASAECYQAAQDALDGKTTVGTYLFFRRAGSKSGYILGNHVFY